MNKKILIVFVLSSLLVNFSVAQNQDRKWTDASGHYEFEGKMIARDDHRVVIEKKDKSLISVELTQLSKKDIEYLETNKEKHFDVKNEIQEWHLENGVTIKGAVVEYGSRIVELRKRRGKIYANDKLFSNLPDLYQQIIPQLVARAEKIDLSKKFHTETWKKKLKTAPKKYQAEGVMLEVENGDLYTIPLFMFTGRDRRILEPGLDSWIKSHPDAHVERDVHSLNMRARALVNKGQKSKRSGNTTSASGSGSSSESRIKKKPDAEEELRRVARLQLQLQAYDAGLFDLWEVTLRAPNGEWRSVIVPGRNSAQAQRNAQAEFPSVETRVETTVKLIRQR